MNNIGILPDLTKDYIYKHLTDEQIFSFYLPISLVEIQRCITTNYLVKSPLRVDNHPTCSFYYAKDGRLRFRDLAGYFWGDCFDVVGYRNHLDPLDSQDFARILNIIARDFRLHKYANSDTDISLIESDNAAYRKRKLRPIISTQRREYLPIDKEVWQRFYLGPKQLKSLWIYPVLNAWINNKLIYSFDWNDPCYEIYICKDNGFEHKKLYFPLRQKGVIHKPRFMTNSNRMMGLHLVKKAKFGIITKSIKDVGVIRLKGVESGSLQGEGIMPMDSEFKFLSSYWEKIYSLLDFDYTGIKTAIKLRKIGIEPLFLTNGRFHTINFKSKDISEFVEHHGWDTYSELVDVLKSESYSYINTPDYFDLLNYLIQ